MQKLSDAERVAKHTNTLWGRLNALTKGARASAKNKGLSFDLDRNYLFDIWEQQKGICIYTGWAMSPITKSHNLVSIDRIDSKKGYIKGNIQLTCWCANRAKSFMDESTFFEMCRAIGKN